MVSFGICRWRVSCSAVSLGRSNSRTATRSAGVVWLNQIPKRAAQVTKLLVEQHGAAQIAGSAPDPETSRWVATAGEKLVSKLATVGLVQQRQSSTLGAFIDSYNATRHASPSIKLSTIKAAAATHKSLRSYFGEQRALRSITKGDAKAWRDKIGATHADNTVRKWTAKAKTLFRSAVDHELIDRNPFDGLQSTLRENRERDYFVTREEIERVLTACPCLEWRLIVSLCRFGGLRCPSEVLLLRWGDVLWGQGRIVMQCPKTAHHEGHETRVMPLFPQLRPLLADAFDQAAPGAEFVINRTR